MVSSRKCANAAPTMNREFADLSETPADEATVSESATIRNPCAMEDTVSTA